MSDTLYIKMNSGSGDYEKQVTVEMLKLQCKNKKYNKQTKSN